MGPYARGIVEATKETVAGSDGVMRSNSGDGLVVKVNQNQVGHALTSALPDEAFEQMRQLQVKSPTTGAYLSLTILGWYRVPDESRACKGSFVKLITAAGFVTLDNDDMTFEETVGHAFTEAGFVVVNGRRLLGVYELVGMFNSVEEWEGLSVEDCELKPRFGEVDFEMTYVIWRPCGVANGSNACVNARNATHGAMVTDPTDNKTYIEVGYSIAYDAETNAAQEISYNNEFPESVVAYYRSPERDVKQQIFEDAPYYCEEILHDEYGDDAEGGMAVWNVTAAVKVGESNATGVWIREFVIRTKVTEMQHLMLNNMDTSVAYTGEANVTYFDYKASGHPVKFIVGDQQIIVKTYEETEVTFADPDDDEW